MTTSQSLIEAAQRRQIDSPRQSRAERNSSHPSSFDRLKNIPGDLERELSKGMDDLSRQLSRTPGEIQEGLQELKNQVQEQYENAHPAVRGALNGLGLALALELIDQGLKLGTIAGKKAAEKILKAGSLKGLSKGILLLTAIDVINEIYNEVQKDSEARIRQFERVAKDAVTREFWSGRGESPSLGDFDFDRGESNGANESSSEGGYDGPSLGGDWDFGDGPDFNASGEFDGGGEGGESEGGADNNDD